MKPDGTEEFILLDQIIVTEEFLNSHPSVEKTQQVINHNRDTKILTNGYRRYIVAKNVRMNLVPIVYEK